VELPGSVPIAFELGVNVGLALRTWPAEHVVKCLVFYHPEDAEHLRAQQITRMRDLSAACIDTGHELLLEIIPPQRAGDGTDTLVRALGQLYDAGICPDWWKLPPSAEPATWHSLGELIAARDPWCQGMLVLGMEANIHTLQASFAAAASQPLCRGFAVGRTIFADAAAAWFANRIDDAEVVVRIAQRYRELIALWDRAEASADARPVHPSRSPNTHSPLVPQLFKGLIS
jgi:5-dehydro-2-deoxygluconokinase